MKERKRERKKERKEKKGRKKKGRKAYITKNKWIKVARVWWQLGCRIMAGFKPRNKEVMMMSCFVYNRRLDQTQLINELFFLPDSILTDIGLRKFNVPLCLEKFFQNHSIDYGHWNTEELIRSWEWSEWKCWWNRRYHEIYWLCVHRGGKRWKL